MRTSETINELATALSKAQAAIKGAVKDATNPHFKSKYADLASVWEACRAPLTSNGLSVVQSVGTDEHGVRITTMLLHGSGQWMADDLVLVPKDNSPQAAGSAITYGRRYALASFAGVAPEDDDAEAAQPRGQMRPQSVAPPWPAGYADWWEGMQDAADNGIKTLEAAWAESSPAMKAHTQKANAEAWAALKAKAAKVPVSA